jgi:predicted neuraminidase
MAPGVAALLDRSLEPIPINHAPGPEYGAEVLNYAMARGIERSRGGRLWAAWVAGGDNDRAFIVAATSDDRGASWSHPRFVIHSKDPEGTPLRRRPRVSNFWSDPTGRLWFFYDQSMASYDGRAGWWAITCENPDAPNPSWSSPRRLWHGSLLNKPIVLSNGEWLAPVTLWARNKVSAPIRGAFPELDPQRKAHVFVSNDYGRSWEQRGGVLIPDTDFDEHMLVELRDGRIWLLARSTRGIMESFSRDRGRTWSDPALRFPHVSSRFFIRRLASGNLLLVRHGNMDERTSSRSHLRAFLSSDDGANWRGGLMLDERDRVSYPDGVQGPDGTIFITYDRDRSGAREILLARFTEGDVLAQQFASSTACSRMIIHRATGPSAPK